MTARDNTQNDTRQLEENVELANAAGKAGLLLVCEHASNHIPDGFSKLGLDDEALKSHVAWDPGALSVAKAMSAALDAPLVATTVSRLVYDCNRAIEAKSAIPEKSETYNIPGNAGLSEEDRLARSKRYYQPFRKALITALERVPPIKAFISVHSFTPVFHGKQRELELGILHDADARLANQLLAVISEEGELNARSNDPYGPKDGVTYSLAEHAMRRGILNVMFEIRNDLIADAKSQQTMAERLARYLLEAMRLLNADLKKTASS